ncbi:MAG: class I SAM-dependent methyltransferase [Candidatus Niyogibacteria bacterium]|nr:MAG: class I SAM-dependent methyltransferase [Candidatus Niyogibacteria bacterium]
MRALLYIKEIWRGKDLYRILMNNECAKYALRGKTADIGAGSGSASYHRFFTKEAGTEIISLDRRTSPIDFEFDRLPYPDVSVDTALAFNILEHIYEYQNLLSEIKRVLKPGGRVYGATPFLVGFHPDPQDFWRYTSSVLLEIFRSNGFKDIEIKILGRGPFIASFFQLEFLFPRLFKMAILPLYFLLDFLFLKLKPNVPKEKFALGLFFFFAK